MSVIHRIPNPEHTAQVLDTRRALKIDTIDDWRRMRPARRVEHDERGEAA